MTRRDFEVGHALTSMEMKNGIENFKLSRLAPAKVVDIR
jgi:hypothetical protein